MLFITYLNILFLAIRLLTSWVLMVAVFSSELINIPETLTAGSWELVGTSLQKTSGPALHRGCALLGLPLCWPLGKRSKSLICRFSKRTYRDLEASWPTHAKFPFDLPNSDQLQPTPSRRWENFSLRATFVAKEPQCETKQAQTSVYKSAQIKK